MDISLIHFPSVCNQLLVVQDEQWWAASALHVREQLRLLSGPQGTCAHPSPRVRHVLALMLARLLRSCSR